MKHRGPHYLAWNVAPLEILIQLPPSTPFHVVHGQGKWTRASEVCSGFSYIPAIAYTRNPSETLFPFILHAKGFSLLQGPVLRSLPLWSLPGPLPSRILEVTPSCTASPLGFSPTWVTAVCFRVPLSSKQNESSLKAGNQVWWITTEDSPKTQGISFWNQELWDTSLSSCLCVCFLKEEGYFCSSIMSVDLNFLCSSIWTTDLTLIVLEGFVLFGLLEAWQSNTSQLSNPQTLQREPHIHPL